MASSKQGKIELIQELQEEIITKLGDEVNELYLDRVVVGVFFTGVILNNGYAGMSATPIKTIPEAVCCPSSAKALPRSGKLKGLTVNQILVDLYSPQGLRRAIAIATLNALAETLWMRDGPPTNAVLSYGDAFSSMTISPTDKVALVGAFPPFMREFRKRNQDFRVLEMDPSTLRPEEMPFYAPADTAPTVIPWADVLITTATTLINGSLQSLLELVKANTEVAIIGPTAPLVTDTFARHKVTIIGGTRVIDGENLLDLLAEGGSGYHFFEKMVERVILTLNKV